ncbi:MAG: hypothetical protein Q4E68_04450 [Prevotellaceae bacterium]|nr:hypothetical protein [Prevotellaceae bacterium]
MELQITRHFKLQWFMIIVLTIFNSYQKASAINKEVLYGKWTSNRKISLPDGCILNDTTASRWGISSVVSSKIYFYENGKGLLDDPAREHPIDFKWTLSNDTINLLDGDTLIQYKIDKNKGNNELYLRILSKGTKPFHWSLVIYSDNIETSDYLYDNSIGKIEMEKAIRDKIDSIKSERRIDEVVVGYIKDKVYHYTYACADENKTGSGIFCDRANWKNHCKFILFVQYDNDTHNYIKFIRLCFENDKYLPDRICFGGREVFH